MQGWKEKDGRRAGRVPNPGAGDGGHKKKRRRKNRKGARPNKSDVPCDSEIIEQLQRQRLEEAEARKARPQPPSQDDPSQPQLPPPISPPLLRPPRPPTNLLSFLSLRTTTASRPSSSLRNRINSITLATYLRRQSFEQVFTTAPSSYIAKAAYSRRTAAWLNSDAPGTVVVSTPQEGRPRGEGYGYNEEIRLCDVNSGVRVSALALRGGRLAAATRTEYVPSLNFNAARTEYPEVRSGQLRRRVCNISTPIQHRYFCT